MKELNFNYIQNLIETTTTWHVNSRRNVDHEKSEPQMGFEPTTLRDLVGCSNHWATGHSVVSKGQVGGYDWNRMTRLHSHVLGSYDLTNNIALSH